MEQQRSIAAHAQGVAVADHRRAGIERRTRVVARGGRRCVDLSHNRSPPSGGCGPARGAVAPADDLGRGWCGARRPAASRRRARAGRWGCRRGRVRSRGWIGGGEASPVHGGSVEDPQRAAAVLDADWAVRVEPVERSAIQVAGDGLVVAEAADPAGGRRVRRRALLRAPTSTAAPPSATAVYHSPCPATPHGPSTRGPSPPPSSAVTPPAPPPGPLSGLRRPPPSTPTSAAEDPGGLPRPVRPGTPADLVLLDRPLGSALADRPADPVLLVISATCDRACAAPR